MKGTAICSIAFGDERYLDQLKNLARSLHEYAPKCAFFNWIDEMPPSSKPFNESLYGFKVYAVNYARLRGFDKVIWLDPAVELVGELDYYFDLIKDYGVIAVADDNPLASFCSTQAFEYFNTTREESKSRYERLCGGSIYVFDFSLPLCNQIFDKWHRAELDGMFGSQRQAESEQINSHRNDESCMSLALYSCGSKPVSYEVAKYNNGEGSIVIKKHFK